MFHTSGKTPQGRSQKLYIGACHRAPGSKHEPGEAEAPGRATVAENAPSIEDAKEKSNQHEVGVLGLGYMCIRV